MTLNEPLVDVGLRLAAPRNSKGHDFASVTLNVRVTNLHLVIGGAITLGILWLVMRPARKTKALPQQVQPNELRPVASLPDR